MEFCLQALSIIQKKTNVERSTPNTDLTDLTDLTDSPTLSPDAFQRTAMAWRGSLAAESRAWPS